ncbi:hypothetical protein APR41_17940 [Salegentibacter salinarum]|uniref:Uncharacterized protein n=1 Tax=Salegentibacter salinarum TaxID=447422 RepID=A0A2N0TTL3_9FLAO|nr:hypothetical protein APR41_17940 [Salegentibacter salinarum]
MGQPDQALTRGRLLTRWFSFHSFYKKTNFSVEIFFRAGDRVPRYYALPASIGINFSPHGFLFSFSSIKKPQLFC